MENNVLSRFKDSLQFGEPIHFKNVVTLPILTTKPPTTDYMGLKEAMQKNFVEVEEISEGGSVPNLKVTNKGKKPLLLIDGEELEGAKQNRICNYTLLLEAEKEHIIPVSCTERGRWAYKTRKFKDSEVIMASKARHAHNSRNSLNLVNNFSYSNNQSEVWSDIETYHGKLKTSSRTRAMKDAFEQSRTTLDNYSKAFPLQANQTGMIIFVNGKFEGIEYVSRPEVYANLHNKLVKSYAIDAMQDIKDTNAMTASTCQYEATQFFDHLQSQESQMSKKKTIAGLGYDFRFMTKASNANLLVNEEEVIYLSGHEFATRVKNDQTPPTAEEVEQSNLIEQLRQQRQQQRRQQVEQQLQSQEEEPLLSFLDRIKARYKAKAKAKA